MPINTQVTKPVSETVTRPVTKSVVIDLVKSRKGNTFVTINGVKVAVFRADGYFNRIKGADKAKTGFRHLADGRIASPKAA